MVAAAGERLAMPSEDWIQHWKVAQFLYDWQTLVAGFLAVLAAWRTIRATVKSADREVAASQAQTAVAQTQIETTIRLERDRVADEARAFRTMLEAAMMRVLSEIVWAKKTTLPLSWQMGLSLRRPLPFDSVSPKARSRSCVASASGGAAL
jgi:hypothetical protein